LTVKSSHKVQIFNFSFDVASNTNEKRGLE